MRFQFFVSLIFAAQASMAFAQDLEIEFSFYLQPDGTGSNTENRFITLEDGELDLEASNAVETVYTQREATAEEISDLTMLVQNQLATIELAAGESLDYPYVEVNIEFDGGDIAAELEYDFAVGSVPDVFVNLQSRFFEGAFR